jgi:putative transposase
MARPEFLRFAVMHWFPLTLRNLEGLMRQRGNDVSHETIRFWGHMFGSTFASKI